VRLGSLLLLIHMFSQIADVRPRLSIPSASPSPSSSRSVAEDAVSEGWIDAEDMRVRVLPSGVVAAFRSSEYTGSKLVR
jgi:hypothetical protein